VNRAAAASISGKSLPVRPIAWMARAGYTARGTVFLLIGVFALLGASSAKARPKGLSGALHTLFAHPFGGVLLWIVALGLACFAGWRFTQGVFDADHHGNSAYGLLRRAVLTCNGLFYLVLAIVAADITVAVGEAKEDQSVRDWTAWLMAKPLGRLAIGLIAAGFVITAIGLGISAFRKPYERRIDSRRMPPAWAATFGIFGLLTRAAVFAMIGAFLGFAAYDGNSAEAVGLAGALATLQRQSYGGALLAVAALGLIAFAGFEFIEAWARRIGTPRVPRI
jgi:hypothetical protein